LENVVVDRPTGCEVESLPAPVLGTVRTRLLRSQIVEGRNGEVLVRYTPVVTNVFTELRFLNRGEEACQLNLVEAKIVGTVLSLPVPQRGEALSGDLNFEAVTNLFLLASGGAVELAGLLLGTTPTHLTGLTPVVLTSDEQFGAF
jgi:hypothetical protein